jgi:hypothetical protein
MFEILPSECVYCGTLDGQHTAPECVDALTFGPELPQTGLAIPTTVPASRFGYSHDGTLTGFSRGLWFEVVAFVFVPALNRSVGVPIRDLAL